MTKLLLSVHVLAAILAIGPIAVAASLFPRYARQSAPGGENRGSGGSGGNTDGRDAGADGRAAGIAAFLHRVCRGYAVVGVVVPVFGIATAVQLDVLTDAWLIVSLVLTAIAAGILALAILPQQERLLELPADTADEGSGSAAAQTGPAAARLSALTGVFNLLWAIVVVLMIVRPGSTTGA
ncbi:membrane protein [Streptomyces hebeiensis]|uniref:Membrane protein n=1 Tax=Streptomyces hebeiensis TaxID=229486 RepID=A0ABN1UUS4_9ACTN